MTLNIQLLVEKPLSQVKKSFIKKSLLKCLAVIKNEIPENVTELSIVLTSDNKIQKLNRKYRKKDKPTDVLSFPQFSKRELKSKKLFGSSLGDIVISVDTTKKQAKEFGVSIKEEFSRLLVHGLLHLLGYDHEKVSKSEAARMRRKEKKLLQHI